MTGSQLDLVWLVGLIFGVLFALMIVIQVGRGGRLTYFAMLQLILAVVLIAGGLLHFNVV